MSEITSSNSEQSGLFEKTFVKSSKESGESDILTPSQRLLAHFSFLLFGIVNLFSWNAIVVQTMYFENVMRTPLKSALNPTLCSFSMGALIIGNSLNIGFLYRFKSKTKIITSLFIFLACFITITCTVWFEAFDILFFIILMFVALLANIVQPIMMSALYEDLRVYPKFSFDMFNMGVAASGLISAVMSIILVPIQISEKKAVMTFFFMAMFLIILCIAVYLCIAKTNFYKRNLDDIFNKCIDSRSAMNKFTSMYSMLKLKWIDAFSLLLCMALTLFIFPTLILSVKPVSSNSEWQKYFVKVVVFLAYGLGDTLGRYINVWIQWPKTQTPSMLILSMSRLGFIILFLLCHRPSANIGIYIMNSDIYPTLWSFLLALTNAHLINRTLSTPYTLKSTDDQVDCMRMMIFTLGWGLTIGAFCSFLVKYL